jgi:alkylation response protein AidB-like acyl-CoA dehydrogenase
MEIREWLKANPPPAVSVSGDSLDALIVTGRKWQAQLASGRWVGVHWPKEFGGRDGSLVDAAIVQEELARVNSPQILGLFGLTMVGPVLIKHGTVAQQERFLPRILDASEIWCQGFSEPQAGSDLAAVVTKASSGYNSKGEQGFFLSGRKVWTSFAQVADWCFVLCRTSRETRQHEGLTYLLVPMRQQGELAQGIMVRPLKQITGDEEFNEVTFEDVFVPAANVVGAIGDGWRIAISTLMYERVILTFARHVQSEAILRSILKEPGSLTISELAEAVSTALAVRALAYEHLTAYAGGGKEPGAEGSLDKLFWSESFQELTRLALKRDGRNGVVTHVTSTTSGNDGRFDNPSLSARLYLYSLGRTIAAGTSEIQKSIIAERVLKLPRGDR